MQCNYIVKLILFNRETLRDLRSYAFSLPEEDNDMGSDTDSYVGAANQGVRRDDKYTLTTARVILLSEISRYLNKKSIPNKKDIVCNALFKSEAFLPDKDILSIFVQEENMDSELKNDRSPTIRHDAVLERYYISIIRRRNDGELDFRITRADRQRRNK